MKEFFNLAPSLGFRGHVGTRIKEIATKRHKRLKEIL
jgi:hypothetical protein